MDYGEFESDIGTVRRALIPRILDKEIRGYIILPKSGERKNNSIIHSHWNLKKDGDYCSPEGKTYLEEIEEELKSRGLAEPTHSITLKTASRMALYNWLLKWGEIPDHLTAYDKNGNIIPKSEIEFFIGDFVVEGMEQDLSLEMKNESDLKDVLKIFKERGHRYESDDDWDFLNGKRIEAKRAFHFADEIPLIALISDMSIRGFDPVSYTFVKKGGSELGSYVPLRSRVAANSFAVLGYSSEIEIRKVNRTFAKFIAKAY